MHFTLLLVLLGAANLCLPYAAATAFDLVHTPISEIKKLRATALRFALASAGAIATLGLFFIAY